MNTVFRFPQSLLLALAFAGSAAYAGEITVDLSGYANEAWTFQGPNDYLIINGSTFPIGAQNFGGVPFLIPDGSHNYWGAGAAANFGPGVVRLTVPVGVYGVTSVFTVMNTMWGYPGPTSYLYVTFSGSAGARRTVPLFGNANVRDYNQDGNTNSIDNTNTVQVWQNGLGQRLDRQQYVLPPEFAAQTLDSITITDTGNEGNGTNGSRAVLAALTVNTCPAFVAERLSASYGAIVYQPFLHLYEQDVTLTNTGTSAIAGPLFFIAENLPAGVALANEASATTCFSPLGSPYVVPLLPGALISPQSFITFRLLFKNPIGVAITYTPLIAGSSGGRP